MGKENKPDKTGFFKRLGALPLILFWLAIEYLTDIRLGKIFSGSDWIRWVQFTGYSGVSFWILVAILLVCLAAFRRELRWVYAATLVIVIVGPILYSYTLPPVPLTEVKNEWVARSAAWISVLILLSFFVKEFIRKK